MEVTLALRREGAGRDLRLSWAVGAATHVSPPTPDGGVFTEALPERWSLGCDFYGMGCGGPVFEV